MTETESNTPIEEQAVTSSAAGQIVNWCLVALVCAVTVFCGLRVRHLWNVRKEHPKDFEALNGEQKTEDNIQQRKSSATQNE